MKKWIVICLLAGVMEGSGQDARTVDSKITDVTVFLSRAQISRQAKTRIEAGKTNLVIAGLTSQLDPESIQVSGKGNFTILGISHQQNFINEFNLPKGLKELRDSTEWMQRQVNVEQAQKEILIKEEQMLLSNQKIGGTNQNITVAELKAMADFYRTRLNEIAVTRMKLDEKIKKLNEGITRLNNQINSQNELRMRNTSEIIVNVSAEAQTAVDLLITYVVSNAGWNPVYDLRAINTKSPVQLAYKANVFQATGEDWKNVQLTLSTANPNQSGLKPELATWYLDFYQPISYTENRKARSYASAPAMMRKEAEKVSEEVSIDAAGTVSDFVQTIQTTLNTEFDIALPYSVLSSSKPTLVDIRNHQINAEYIYSVAPKLDTDAFLMARATGWEEFSLLPGEANIFFEGTFVGKTFIDPNNIKDTLSISLGRDKRIVVKREKLKDMTSRKVIGANQRESYTWEVSVRNTKAESIKIKVEDQVPVSQNSQIEVTLLEAGGGKYNALNGKLTWDMTLNASEAKKVIFKYEIKYPKDRQVNGL